MKTEGKYHLAEQREKFVRMFGGISTYHVVRYSTFKSGKHPGCWTRKAYDRRALCGSLGACVVGSDAKEFPVVGSPLPDITGVINCQRCRKRWNRMKAKERKCLPTTN